MFFIYLFGGLVCRLLLLIEEELYRVNSSKCESHVKKKNSVLSELSWLVEMFVEDFIIFIQQSSVSPVKDTNELIDNNRNPLRHRCVCGFSYCKKQTIFFIVAKRIFVFSFFFIERDLTKI